MKNTIRLTLLTIVGLSFCNNYAERLTLRKVDQHYIDNYGKKSIFLFKDTKQKLPDIIYLDKTTLYTPYSINHINATGVEDLDLHGTLYTNPETKESFSLAIKNDEKMARTYKQLSPEEKNMLEHANKR